MARKVKVLNLAPYTRQDAEKLLADYAIADAREAEINSIIEQRCTEIRREYDVELAGIHGAKGELFDQLQQYALENRDEFGDRKSMGFTHGIIGFRTGMPKLKLLKGFKWEAVTNLLVKKLPAYVRTVKEPAKDKLLADRNMPAVAKKLRKVGIEVVQDETFYVEPKKEEVASAL